MSLRIGLFGGPGCGKSTLAAETFAILKKPPYEASVELVSEWVKDWVYEGRKIDAYDQLYVFAKQHRKEYRVLRAGIETIVSDSPLYLQCFYARKFDVPIFKQLMEIAEAFEYEHPSVNIMLQRHDSEYQQNGRYQNEEQAKEVDREIRQFFDDFRIPFVEMKPDALKVVDLVNLETT